MEVTRVEQRAYIKIAVLRERNALECHSELVKTLGNNALPHRTVARWIGKFQQGCVSTSDEQRSGLPVSVRTDLARTIIEQLIDYIRVYRGGKDTTFGKYCTHIVDERLNDIDDSFCLNETEEEVFEKVYSLESIAKREEWHILRKTENAESAYFDADGTKNLEQPTLNHVQSDTMAPAVLADLTRALQGTNRGSGPAMEESENDVGSLE
ncbi:uncharacterized protein TNCV_4824851 [Trichonephila clavipes]|uniref:Mos1 transposase HTH domain-containing protein n=1 Tax=Trichonephila clavipes TaxID=2585209 RepID=A0A8X6RMX3_TRICX|nr:uncharacterized protein TNCV_4824851 [Trichonephila clavipes]